jgi:hypothetical protein
MRSSKNTSMNSNTYQKSPQIEIGENQMSQNLLNGKATRHRNLKMNRCVVCGSERAGVTRYVYYASGRTRLYAPFCQRHIEKLEKYANPVFENQAALELFKKMFPQTFRQDVQGKTILFFDTYRRKKPN